MAAGTTTESRQLLKTQARSALSMFADVLNTQVNGAYLFAGINADVKPIADYDRPRLPPTSRPWRAPSRRRSGSRSRIRRSPTSRQTTCRPFSTPRSPICSGSRRGRAPGRAASDQNVRSRISNSELVDTSANANDETIRKLVGACTMVADLGTANLNQGAFKNVIDKATEAHRRGDPGPDDPAGGSGQSRSSASPRPTSRMTVQTDIMTNHIGALEGVDPYEASTASPRS